MMVCYYGFHEYNRLPSLVVRYYCGIWCRVESSRVLLIAQKSVVIAWKGLYHVR